LDWWVDYRNNMKQWTFIRCPECGKIGENKETEVEAIEVWNK
jgi:hypothetical protein